jgi:transcriptional regulator with XRE-family HTH domain
MRKSIHSARYQLLLDWLVAARQSAGLTQQQVADKLGRPQSFVAKYEGGERRLDVVEMVEIAHLLGADPHEAVRVVVPGK